MKPRLAVVMDPIWSINIKKDSTFALLLEAQRRDYQLFHLEQRDLYLENGQAFGHARPLSIRDDAADWFTLDEPRDTPLVQMDLILMRKDPPYDSEYHYSTHILDHAAPALVVNRPQSLRDANEKLYACRFPELCPPTLVSRERARLKAFIAEHGDIVVKPLDSMGGASVFRLRNGDPNINVVLETVTLFDRRTVMAQRYLPEVASGDRRILLFHGEPAPYALVRVPMPGETRANLAAGGSASGAFLTAREKEICSRIGPELAVMGLWFVGIDVIGDWLTEINVTSPTGIRELDRFFDENLAARLFDALPKRER